MKEMMKSFGLLGSSVVLFLAFSCAQPPPAPVYVKDGKEYGKTKGAFFRHRWWNYYERGLSYEEGRFYQEALSDLKQALEQREKDQRMARTYGMHFMDYFPHRELGIVFYEMGNLEAARDELTLSLSQFPSAKAYYYLDQVRKKLIEKEGKDVGPPGIHLALKAEEIWTRDDPVVLAGIVENENYVSSLTVGGKPVFLEASRKRVPFREQVALSQGFHSIDIVAKNLIGQIAKKTVQIHIDREGPVISLEEIQVDEEKGVKVVAIRGSLYDESHVLDFSINSERMPIQQGVEAFFSKQILTEGESLTLVAKDRLGNETAAEVSLGSPSTAHAPVMLAYGGDHWNRVLAGLFGGKDSRPPRIEIKGWTGEQTVYLDKAFIEGQVTDESEIESLTINDIPVLRRKGVHVFFNHLAELKEGKNAIAIAANDGAGNRETKTITIERRLPEALQLEQRLSLTVLPFEQKGTVSEAGLSFQDNLISSIVDRNRFKVVERTLLDVVLEEQKLSQTKLIERSTALQVGKLVAARSVITGSIIETRQGIEIVARMIDTESAEIMDTEDVYDEVKDLGTLKLLAEGMAVKFHREFPLVSGQVLQKKGKYIFTDLGKDKIKIQRRLIVYREEPVTHPLTGKPLGTDTEIIGRARVTQVNPEMSKSELISGLNRQIGLEDKVITE